MYEEPEGFDCQRDQVGRIGGTMVNYTVRIELETSFVGDEPYEPLFNPKREDGLI